jgi:hypothetical protein
MNLRVPYNAVYFWNRLWAIIYDLWLLASREGLYSMEFVEDHGIKLDEITTVCLWL